MAFYDWNRDGKKDFADDYIEYNIYKECTKDENNSNSYSSSNYSNNNYPNNSSSSNSGCSFWFWFFVIMFILGIITD